MVSTTKEIVAGFVIGSEDVTFSANAPADIAGTTATRWYAADPEDGHKIICGVESRERVISLAIEREAEDKAFWVPVESLPKDSEGYPYRWDECIGLYRVSTCCGAATSINDGPLYCKKCYEEADCDGPAVFTEGTQTLTLVTGRGDRETLERYLYGGNEIVDWHFFDGRFVAVVINRNDRETYQTGRLQSAPFGVTTPTSEVHRDALRFLFRDA